MPPAPLTNLTILVVDDHEDGRTYVQAFLRRMGANVIGARNAIEGLEAVQIHRPALILSDIMMPGIDGFEFLREIRATESVGEPGALVIAMTAVVSPADGRRILDAGFRAYLRKPFTPEKLLETIESVLND
jgi:CheY-like chemotaxis protein